MRVNFYSSDPAAAPIAIASTLPTLAEMFYGFVFMPNSS